MANRTTSDERRTTSDERRATEFRIGIGYDIHKLVSGRKLILGGVKIPFDKGLDGHSDADALLHAIADALLGACSMGNIGIHFPDTDPKFKDMDSKVLVRKTIEMISEAGFKPVNIDANIIAENPRLSPFLEEMQKNIASLLGLKTNFVSIKPRTNEGMDAIGRGEAIAVQAVVMIEPELSLRGTK